MAYTEADYAEFVRRGLVSQPPRALQGEPPPIPEGALLARVRRLALQAGWLFYHTHDSRRSDPGFPDVVLCRPGSLLFVELKTATGKVSEEQAVWIDVLCHSVPGVEAYVWRPDDWPRIQARLMAPIGGTHGPTP